MLHPAWDFSCISEGEGQGQNIYWDLEAVCDKNIGFIMKGLFRPGVEGFGPRSLGLSFWYFGKVRAEGLSFSEETSENQTEMGERGCVLMSSSWVYQ